jgi:hypothetical protein
MFTGSRASPLSSSRINQTGSGSSGSSPWSTSSSSASIVASTVTTPWKAKASGSSVGGSAPSSGSLGGGSSYAKKNPYAGAGASGREPDQSIGQQSSRHCKHVMKPQWQFGEDLGGPLACTLAGASSHHHAATMARLLSDARCVHHPERPGYALCQQCRAVVCQECATSHNGALHCPRCLAAGQQAALALAWWDRPWLHAVVAIACFAALARVLPWMLALWLGVMRA